MATKKKITLGELIAPLSTEGKKLIETLDAMDETPIEATTLEVGDDKKHAYDARKIYNIIRSKIDVIKNYFIIENSKIGIIPINTFSDSYSTIKIKFLYTHKKVLLIFKENNIEVSLFKRTLDIISNIDNLYEVIDTVNIKDMSELINLLSHIFSWGLNKYIPENTRYIYNQRVFATKLVKECLPLDKRLKHILYFGIIDDYTILKTNEDTVVYKLDLLLENNERLNVDVTLAKEKYIDKGLLYFTNYKGTNNIFSIKGIKNLVDFASADFRLINQYLNEKRNLV